MEQELSGSLERDGIDFVRVCWADQHGISRSKTVSRMEFLHSLERGRSVQMAPAVLDSGNFPFVDPFAAEAPFGVPALAGMPSGIARPDPATFRQLPWLERTGWILSDTFLPDGSPSPLDTRGLLRTLAGRLRDKGLDLQVGLEVEFYVFRLEDDQLHTAAAHPATPRVSLASHGFQAYSEERFDRLEPLVRRLTEMLTGAGLPVATMESEWGPGQIEMTLPPMPVTAAADAMLFARSAIKQVCRRSGFLASFMACPNFAGIVPSGWHIHQSLVRTDGCVPLMGAITSGSPLSDEGRAWVGGLLAHASATSLLTTPTVNGYKRQRPNSFAPTNASWGVNNRSVMIRVLGQGDDAHIENRSAEPAANPYLALAAQLIAGLDGLERRLDPGDPVANGYTSAAPALPSGLSSAIAAFEASQTMRNAIGTVLHDYLIAMKSAEWNRFTAAVTDWEQAEYLDVF